jgi:hypothetical protein
MATTITMTSGKLRTWRRAQFTEHREMLTPGIKVTTANDITALDSS